MGTGPDSVQVVIAGASFAGLAAARALGGRALLIDQESVGEGQTSACGAPARVLDALYAADAIQEIHRELVIHTPGREIRWPLPEPFCTFDYRECCRAAFASSGAALLRASVRGHRGPTVAVTSEGEIEGRILVDATGWRRALARRLGDATPDRRGGGRAHDVSGVPDRGGRYFGLEAEVPAAFPAGLHFYFWPDVVRDGYAWVFPAGRVARVGLLSYHARSSLAPQLNAFLSRLELPSGPRHGGFLGVRLVPPVLDGVFMAGDAAGHCLPFTGEGIRSAVWAGLALGGLIDDVLARRISRAEAQARYAAFVGRQRRCYRVLQASALAVLTLPARTLGVLAAWVARPGPLRAFMRHYLSIFSTDDSAIVNAGRPLPA